jgi:FkbM family methyltransferase
MTTDTITAGGSTGSLEDPGTLRSFLTRAFALASGRFGAAAFSAVWLVVAARYLSLPDFGDLGVILATTTVLATVSERGIQTVLAIHVAKHQAIDANSVGRALLGRLPTTAFACIINAALYVSATGDRRWLIPALGDLSLIGTAIYSTLLAAYRAVGRVRADALNEVLSRIWVAVFGIALLLRGSGLVGAMTAYASADVLSAVLVSAVIARRHITRQLTTERLKVGLRATAPVALMMVALTVYYRLDTYLVAVLRGSAAAGLYSASYRLLDVATIPAIAVGSLVLSRTVRLSAQDRLRTLSQLTLLSLSVSVPVAVVGVLAGEPIMVLLYGARFSAAGSCASLLLLSAVPSIAVGMIFPIVIPNGPRPASILALLVLALNLAGNWPLILALGINGAAIVNLASQLVLAAGIYYIALAQARRARRATRVPGHSFSDAASSPIVPARGTLVPSWVTSTLVRMLVRVSWRPLPIGLSPTWRFGDIRPGWASFPRRLAVRLSRRPGVRPVVTVSWYNDTRLTLDVRTDMGASLFLSGAYEPNEVRFITTLLRQGQTAVDIGANVGWLTLVMAAAVGPTGRVVAVEPSPREHAVLEDHLARNRLSWVIARPEAVADRRGALTLHIADHAHPGQNTFGAFAYGDVREVDAIMVPTITMDAIIRDDAIGPVALVKMDVEGAEYRVLLGAGNTLRQVRPVFLLEVQPASLAHMGDGESQLLETLRSEEYVLYTFDAATGLPTRLVTQPCSSNLVAVPLEQVASLERLGAIAACRSETPQASPAAAGAGYHSD